MKMHLLDIVWVKMKTTNHVHVGGSNGKTTGVNLFLLGQYGKQEIMN
ncbi:hypothetical protein ACWOFB_13025 [Enterococcus hermanniensis]